MTCEFLFDDSEVRGVTRVAAAPGHAPLLRIGFSAAQVTQDGAAPGFAPGLSITLGQPWLPDDAPPLDEVIGRVREGRLLWGSQQLARLQVPQRLYGQLVLALDLANGSLLHVHAQALNIRFEGAVQMRESMAC